MIDKIDIKKLKIFIHDYKLYDEIPLCNVLDTDILAEQIADVLNEKIIVKAPTKHYIIYQTKENFIDIVDFKIGEINTDDIDKALNEFCEENGDSWLFNIKTLTCHDKYGNEVKFVEEIGNE